MGKWVTYTKLYLLIRVLLIYFFNIRREDYLRDVRLEGRMVLIRISNKFNTKLETTDLGRGKFESFCEDGDEFLATL
jgi:hypothetical protein